MTIDARIQRFLLIVTPLILTLFLIGHIYTIILYTSYFVFFCRKPRLYWKQTLRNSYIVEQVKSLNTRFFPFVFAVSGVIQSYADRIRHINSEPDDVMVLRTDDGGLIVIDVYLPNPELLNKAKKIWFESLCFNNIFVMFFFRVFKKIFKRFDSENICSVEENEVESEKNNEKDFSSRVTKKSKTKKKSEKNSIKEAANITFANKSNKSFNSKTRKVRKAEDGLKMKKMLNLTHIKKLKKILKLLVKFILRKIKLIFMRPFRDRKPILKTKKTITIGENFDKLDAKNGNITESTLPRRNDKDFDIKNKVYELNDTKTPNIISVSPVNDSLYVNELDETEINSSLISNDNYFTNTHGVYLNKIKRAINERRHKIKNFLLKQKIFFKKSNENSDDKEDDKLKNRKKTDNLSFTDDEISDNFSNYDSSSSILSVKTQISFDARKSEEVSEEISDIVGTCSSNPDTMEDEVCISDAKNMSNHKKNIKTYIEHDTFNEYLHDKENTTLEDDEIYSSQNQEMTSLIEKIKKCEIKIHDANKIYNNDKVERNSILLVHGFNGSSNSNYIKNLAINLRACGYTVFAFNCRGTRLPLQTPVFYHIGFTDDLKRAVDYILNNYNGTLSLVGFSLGGNWVCKFLGEERFNNNPVYKERIMGAMAVSVPFNFKQIHQIFSKWHYRISIQRIMTNNYKAYLLRNKKVFMEARIN
ncbi:hypothetical protein EDEG_03039, partial [Edhazardia aedis USNM 41457]